MTDLLPCLQSPRPPTQSVDFWLLDADGWHRHRQALTSDITSEPAGDYVGITRTVSCGCETLLSNEAGIVNTGTILIYIPSSAYNRYVSATDARR
ncbi:uncharacterized protein B0H18DRAFT_1122620 [Fomitopsis serialis]|uniref:uncharacterized protein n=1 Tax=Fomitopsis serialis TaxID=139415 RepID=UPI002007D9A3|nr:uncharacterized protein B0H18DRAFT_1122620 [Neoantrodia serialis]KAH9919258.1 hypothetical protein B0H18DRAFT_1122620 [Neoantrodia serialis]